MPKLSEFPMGWVNYVLGISDVLIFFVFLPVHVAVCWVLFKNRFFSEQPVYTLLCQLLIANIIGLISTIGAGIFELAGTELFLHLNVTMAALALWYRHIYSTLTLFLSINRLSWITSIAIPYEKDFYKYFFFALWFAFTVLIMFANYVRLNIGYNFEVNGFSYFTEKAQSENAFPDYVYTMAMLMLSSFTYGIAAAAVIRCKCFNLYIDPEEYGVFVQLIAIFVPKMLMRFSRHVLLVYCPNSGLLQVNIFLYRIVPALNICSLPYQNKRLRECTFCLVSLLRKKRSAQIGTLPS
ncbi:hypothetical protein QR680_009857 [Steinernema hermaphroditum]|uniref:Uncharacterized protein n=1 Tax=Steinernema hermaphroditum TaxID=289476 RepID=A0AA39IPC9_9BILA|nr:hypothetical protein QR680_009857 [Steinernema hermaphroditum]